MNRWVESNVMISTTHWQKHDSLGKKSIENREAFLTGGFASAKFRKRSTFGARRGGGHRKNGNLFQGPLWPVITV